MVLYSTEKEKQKAIVIVVLTKKSDSKARKLDEVIRLAETTDLEVVESFSQNVKDFNKGTVIGTGKIEEIKDFLKSNPVDVVVVDFKLTGSQIKNLSSAFETRVVDRVGLILDIFAKRATTNEAKLQVKLAQNIYLLPKLREVQETSNKYGGAGVGMRGPGETKLELDRRRLEKEIDFLKKEISKIKTQRQVSRRSREKSEIKLVALVGYTNAGKSSLLNALTKEKIYVEDKYFATLDTTSRKLFLDGKQIVLTDTVGFISELPHELVDSFASTLEEAKQADLILHVVDPTATSKNGEELYYEESMRVTEAVLDEIGATKNRLVVYNKCDLVEKRKNLNSNEIYVSAKTKEGLEQLKEKIKNMI